MQHHESKARLLNAAHQVVRAKGYAATRIEDICAAAGVTKGSFFHHFKSKEELALEAVAEWDANAAKAFAKAPYRDPVDPLDRLLAYVDFRKAILVGDLPDFTCFAGALIQEVYRTHPEILSACKDSLLDHADELRADIEAAVEKYGVIGEWSAASLALHIQSVIQGGFILAKATGSAAAAADSLAHLRRYLELLFAPKSVRKRR